MTMLRKQVLNLASTLSDNLIQWRNHLHANPELSFQEVNTSAFLKNWLTQRSIPYKEGYAEHGLVVDFKAATNDNRYLVLRADMDALPITEQSSKSYCSVNPGVMHACGHDVHMTCLMGAIDIINQLQSELKVNVRCIFQPGEEKLPGGATIMIDDGAVSGNDAHGIIALHVDPALEVGTLGFRPGMYMASADELYFTITGKGGHGAMPHECIDPVLITAQIITALQEITSRNCPPDIPCVLTIGDVHTVGGATNIIPETVHMAGTFRTMDEAWRSKAHELIVRTVTGIAQSLGGKAEVNIMKGYPVLINDEAMTAFAIDQAGIYLGENNIHALALRMTSEDFAWYTQQMPGCFFRLGTGNKSKKITSGVHTPTFDIDEDCLEVGAGIIAFLALNFSPDNLTG